MSASTDLSWLRLELRSQVQRVSSAKASLQSMRLRTEEEAQELEVERSLLAAELEQEQKAIAKVDILVNLALRKITKMYFQVIGYLGSVAKQRGDNVIEHGSSKVGRDEKVGGDEANSVGS